MTATQTASPEASRCPGIHVIDPHAGFCRSLVRMIARRLGTDVPCSVSRTPEAFFGSVTRGSFPRVIVTSNLHGSEDGIRLAERLRREGYAGKIFIFTGGARPLPSVGVDGIYVKAQDHAELLDAIEAAFRASR